MLLLRNNIIVILYIYTLINFDKYIFKIPIYHLEDDYIKILYVSVISFNISQFILNYRITNIINILNIASAIYFGIRFFYLIMP